MLGKWTGNLVALPNNRVRATSPALWVTGEGAPDFAPSQWTHSAEAHESYLDPFTTFNNLYDDTSYKKEYQNYHGKAEQIKKRTAEIIF